MKDYLTLLLYAPIAAMGASVTGPWRLGWSRPGRSAVLCGIVAGSMGIFDEHEEELEALERDIGLAMLVERSGTPFTDFQTVRIASSVSLQEGRCYLSRADELDAIRFKDNAKVSHREYRADVVVLVVLWCRGKSKHGLDQITESLHRPAITPYMGRKACPLGLPMCPLIEKAASPVEALIRRAQNGPERSFLGKPRGGAYIALDREDAPPGEHKIEERADRLLSRARRQFGRRAEAIIPVTL